MKTKIIDITIPEDRQRREMGDIQDMADSLQEFGLIQPIVISDNTLVVGERRLRAAELLGWEDIETNQKDDLSSVRRMEVELEENLRRKNLTYEEQCTAVKKIYDLHKSKGGSIRTVEKQLGMSRGAVHDAVKMSKAFKAIPALAKTKTAHQARKLLQAVEKREIRNEIIRRRTEGKALDGQFVNMDCREYLKTLPEESIDVVLMDPQFGIDIENRRKFGLTQGSYGKVYGNDDKPDDLFVLFNEILPLLYRVMKKDSHLFMFFGIQHYALIRSMIEERGFDVRPIPLIWAKENFQGQSQRPEKWPASTYEPFFFAHKGFKTLAMQGRKDTFLYGVDPPSQKKHPFQKPLPLLRDILNMSTLPGSTVLDPFAGTASTLIAAKLNKMDYFGCEIDHDWFSEGQWRLSLY